MIKARLTVLAAVLFVCANALAVGDVPAPWLFPLSACAAAALYFCPLFGRRPQGSTHGAIDVGARCESTFRRNATIVVATIPLFAYAYTFIRIHSGDDILLLSRYKYVRARVQIQSVETKPSATQFVAKLIALERPFFPSHGERLLLSLRSPIRIMEQPAPVANRSLPGVGEVATIGGRLLLPRIPKQPWDFDEINYVKRRGCIARFEVHSISRIESSEISKLAAETSGTLVALRKRILDAHQRALGTECGALLTSMVIGSGAVKLPDDLILSFQKVGLSHVLAASGFNLTVVTVSIWFLIRLLTKSPIISNAVVLAAVVLFVALAGSSASVNRAAIMCLFMLLGRSVHRSAYLPATLSLSLISTLLLDPLALGDIGFQLSYAATVGIVCFANLPVAYLEENEIKCPAWLVEAVFVTAVAELSVLPVQLFHFWQIGVLSLPVNIIVSPVVPLVTVFGFASSGLLMIGNPFFDAIALLLDKIILYPVWVLDASVRWLAGLQWAWLSTGPSSIFQIVCYYSCFLLLLCAAVHRRFFFLSVMAFTAAGAFLFWRTPLRETLRIADRKGSIEISTAHTAVVRSDDAKHFKRIAAYYAIPETAVVVQTVQQP